MTSSTPNHKKIPDESPFPHGWRKILPRWLRQFLPTGGGDHHREEERTLFGFVSFLISESFIFLSFIVSYIGLRSTVSPWIPPGVSGSEISTMTIISTVVLLSSSIVIYFAERALKKGKLWQFRLLWLTTAAMGAFFLYAEISEWLGNDFGPSTGIMGSAYYLLTGFHGLHVTIGIVLLTIMFLRSFIPHIYRDGNYGVTAISWFWHFVDVVWVFVFSLIYLW